MAEEIKKEPPANFKVTIDNITIDVPPGTSILNAARKIGGEVAPPAMCYYSKLQGSGILNHLSYLIYHQKILPYPNL